MSAVRQVLRRSAGVLALGLALALVLGSLCPRGWFVCLHEQEVVLTDAGHAADERDCTEQDCCPEDGACLDLAISLVLDDQSAAAPLPVSLPAAPMVGLLPDAVHALVTLESPGWVHLGDPPLPELIRHVRLLV